VRHSCFGYRQLSTADEDHQSVIVYGGAGGLGNAIVGAFDAAGWFAISVDFKENSLAGHSILVPSEPWDVATKDVSAKIQDLNVKADVVVNAAGGWMGGSVGSEDMFESVDKMISQNLLSALASGYLASKHLRPEGLVVLTGAAAVYAGGCSSGMVGYSVAKAGVHDLVKSLSEPDAIGKPCTVIGMLPNVIDTVANRKAMPSADHDTWTNPDVFARAIVHWAVHKEETPNFPSLEHGRCYEFKTLKNGRSVADYIDQVETRYTYNAAE